MSQIESRILAGHLKAGDHLPLPDLVIAIEMLPDESRRITLTAYTPTGTELLA